MCTAVNLIGNYHFFGRNLDLDRDYGEVGVITPKNHTLPLRYMGNLVTSHAILGAGIVSGNVPLYFDAMNNCGLCAAGLNFPNCAVYNKPISHKLNLCSFELIPYILSNCKNVTEAVKVLKDVNITDDPFSENLPATPLHWIFGDRSGAVIAEPLLYGLSVKETKLGVLTNSPEYTYHEINLNKYPDLSPESPSNKRGFTSSLGTGSASLPGGLSSEDRFVRASFFTGNSHKGSHNEERGDFFSMLSSVSVPKGSVITDSGELHYTRYTSCCDSLNNEYLYYKRTSLSTTILTFTEENVLSTEISKVSF